MANPTTTYPIRTAVAIPHARLSAATRLPRVARTLELEQRTPDTWMIHRREGQHVSTVVIPTRLAFTGTIDALTTIYRAPNVVLLDFTVVSDGVQLPVTIQRRTTTLSIGRNNNPYVVMDISELKPLLRLLRENLHGSPDDAEQGRMSLLALEAEDALALQEIQDRLDSTVERLADAWIGKVREAKKHERY